MNYVPIKGGGAYWILYYYPVGSANIKVKCGGWKLEGAKEIAEIYSQRLGVKTTICKELGEVFG